MKKINESLLKTDVITTASLVLRILLLVTCTTLTIHNTSNPSDTVLLIGSTTFIGFGVLLLLLQYITLNIVYKHSHSLLVMIFSVSLFLISVFTYISLLLAYFPTNLAVSVDIILLISTIEFPQYMNK